MTKLFSVVADRYDAINMVMSFGLLPRWRRVFFSVLDIQSGHRVLDVCAGTGWLTETAIQTAGQDGHVTAVDLCPDMLRVARQRLVNVVGADYDLVVGDAHCLPYEDHSFDRVMVGFGLRNVADVDQVLRELCRVCIPGGRIAIIELTHPPRPVVRWLFRHYRWRVLPALDLLISKDKRGALYPYKYLGRSVDGFYDAVGLQAEMESAGWDEVTYEYVGVGAVAIHSGTNQPAKSTNWGCIHEQQAEH